MIDYSKETKEDLIIALEMNQLTINLLNGLVIAKGKEIERLTKLSQAAVTQSISEAEKVRVLEAEVKRLTLKKVCNCVIEMATFRTKGDPCPHCGLEVTDTLLL